MNQKIFLEGTEVMKANIFTENKTHWLPIRDKVEAWVKEGWATREEEKPEWFTDLWKARVSEDMKPVKKMGGFD